MIASTRVTLLLPRESNFPSLVLCAARSLRRGYQFALSRTNFYKLFFLLTLSDNILYPALLFVLTFRFISFPTKKTWCIFYFDSTFKYLTNIYLKNLHLHAKQTLKFFQLERFLKPLINVHKIISQDEDNINELWGLACRLAVRSLYWQKLGVLYKFSARGQTN